MGRKRGVRNTLEPLCRICNKLTATPGCRGLKLIGRTPPGDQNRPRFHPTTPRQLSISIYCDFRRFSSLEIISTRSVISIMNAR